MFGLMKGSCGLAPCERAAWMGHLCGLCEAARQAGGHSARLATNPDAALLSALCAAQRRARGHGNNAMPTAQAEDHAGRDVFERRRAARRFALVSHGRDRHSGPPR